MFRSIKFLLFLIVLATTPLMAIETTEAPVSIANLAQDEYNIIKSKFIDLWSSPVAPTQDTNTYLYEEWSQIRALIQEDATIDAFNTNPFDPSSRFFEVTAEIKCEELPLFEKFGIPLVTFNNNPLFPDYIERKLTESEFDSFSHLKNYLSSCLSDSLLSQAALFVEIEYIALLLEKRGSQLAFYQQVSLNTFEESFLEPVKIETDYNSLLSLQEQMICWENICRESKCDEDNSDYGTVKNDKGHTGKKRSSSSRKR